MQPTSLQKYMSQQNKKMPNYGRCDSHPPHRHHRTGHETFVSSGSSKNSCHERLLQAGVAEKPGATVPQDEICAGSVG